MNKKVYKYTRKSIWWILEDYKEAKNITPSEYARIQQVQKDLLAQKEDKKKCKHKFGETYTGGKRCNKCNMSLAEFKYSTPSPLEIEEIEEISKFHTNTTFKLVKLVDKVNQLISNQKKLYQYIKEKKL